MLSKKTQLWNSNTLCTFKEKQATYKKPKHCDWSKYSGFLCLQNKRTASNCGPSNYCCTFCEKKIVFRLLYSPWHMTLSACPPPPWRFTHPTQHTAVAVGWNREGSMLSSKHPPLSSQPFHLITMWVLCSHTKNTHKKQLENPQKQNTQKEKRERQKDDQKE